MLCLSFFFFQAEDGIRDVAVTGVQTCALPISTAKKLHQIRAALQGLKASLRRKRPERGRAKDTREAIDLILEHLDRDRKSTRLNSSHGYISYAVFCLKKKNKIMPTPGSHASMRAAACD